MPRSNIERLETIAIKLGCVPGGKKSNLLRDMDWLVSELRKAWLELEKREVTSTR